MHRWKQGADPKDPGSGEILFDGPNCNVMDTPLFNKVTSARPLPSEFDLTSGDHEGPNALAAQAALVRVQVSDAAVHSHDLCFHQLRD
mmetsp:Transcript_55259/g.128911  ORF Transcript_55259/g.128911 Transcript_55259/m.128911 type:complete len:88 (-) Transcript_55259:39-302(-)